MLKNHFIYALVFCVFSFQHLTHAKTLIISDSHGTGAFGGELAKLIETKNESVDFYAFGGTKAIDWIEGNNLTWGYWEHHTGRFDRRGTNRNTPKLTHLIQLHKPNTVVIVQGTNMVWRETTTADYENVRFLIDQVNQSGAKCYWVGPPDLNVKTDEQNKWVLGIHQLLEQSSQMHGCQLIRSWAFTQYPEGLGDGIHYDQIPNIGAKLAQEWARGVFTRF